MLIPDSLLVTLGTYLAWAGGAFAVLYADLEHGPARKGQWGLWQWAGACVLVGGLALPFYFWVSRASGAGLVTGIFFGIAVTLVAFALRLALSMLLAVPLA